MKKITIQLLAVVCAMVMFAGKARAQATVQLSSHDTIRLVVGEIDSIKATISPLGETLAWSSVNSAIATVVKAAPDSTWGRINAVHVGETKIVVAYGNSATPARDTVVVKVYDPVTSVSLNKDRDTIGIGLRDTLYATVNPGGAYNGINFSSTMPGIATVTRVGNMGIITAVSPGRTNIIVSAGKGSNLHTDTCEVLVNNPITSIAFAIAQDTIPMQINSEADMAVKVQPANADNQSLLWSVEPVAPETRELVKIISNAALMAKIQTQNIPGLARLTVTTPNGLTASRIIKVLAPIHVTAMMLDKDTVYLSAGTKDTITACIKPANALNKKVTWTSTNPSFASVESLTDTTAVVTGKTVGVAMIVGETKDGSLKDTCYIYVRNAVGLKGAKLTKHKIRLSLAKSDTLRVEFTPANAIDKRVVWSSADTTIARVDSNGVVTTLKSGITFVHMTTVEGAFKDSCEVTAYDKDANIEANAGIGIWSTENGFRVQSDKPRMLAVYTLSGALYRKETVVGDRVIYLPSGLYIITLGEVSRKVAIP